MGDNNDIAEGLIIDNNDGTIHKEQPITKGKQKSKLNIFDEFSTDTGLKEDLKKMKKESNKDKYFYIWIGGRVLQVLFFILFVVFAFMTAYIYIQKNESIESQSYLDPICGIITGGIPVPVGSCSSIAYLSGYYNNEFEELNENQTELIIEILPDVFESESFLNSKEVSFLLDKSHNKLKVIEILSKFDSLKNDFLGIDRKRLVCNNLEIDSEKKVISMKCIAYMQGFSSVIGFDGDKNQKNVSGTAISLANSFLNYIQKNSNDFTIINRQKVFTVEGITSEDGYTNKTEFDLNLQYNF